MNTIEIDFEVYKALTSKRASESHTYNDVLREMLNLPQKENDKSPATTDSPWFCKDVTFPEGTEFRGTYKGVQHTGTVKDGGLIVAGKKYTSPSAAAVAIVGGSVNGWNFWECKLPHSQQWILIARMRK